MAALHDSNALLVFRVGPVFCCAPAGPVVGIIVPPKLSRLPGTTAAEPGIFRHAGAVVRVVDLRERFGIAAAERDGLGRVIITHLQAGHIGYRVDGIGDVLPMPGEGWSPLPPQLPRDIFTRAYFYRDRIALYTDFERVRGLHGDQLRGYLAQLEEARQRDDTGARASGELRQGEPAAAAQSPQMPDIRDKPAVAHLSQPPATVGPHSPGPPRPATPLDGVGAAGGERVAAAQAAQSRNAAAIPLRGFRRADSAPGDKPQVTPPAGSPDRPRGAAVRPLPPRTEPPSAQARPPTPSDTPVPQAANRGAPAAGLKSPVSWLRGSVAALLFGATGWFYLSLFEADVAPPRPMPVPIRELAQPEPVAPVVAPAPRPQSAPQSAPQPAPQPASRPQLPPTQTPVQAPQPPDVPPVPSEPPESVTALAARAPPPGVAPDRVVQRIPPFAGEPDIVAQLPPPAAAATVTISRDSEGLVIEIQDRSPDPGAPRQAATAAESESRSTLTSVNAAPAPLVRTEVEAGDRVDPNENPAIVAVDQERAPGDPPEAVTSPPRSEPEASTHPTASRSPPPAPSPPRRRVMVVHTVVQGDTLWHIAIRYLGDPFRYPELARLSRIRDPDLIYPGNKVKIIRIIE